MFYLKQMKQTAELMFLFRKAETAGERCSKASCKYIVSNVLLDMDGFVSLLNAVSFLGLDAQ